MAASVGLAFSALFMFISLTRQCEEGQITREALGRMASVGDLYDARNDKFCGVSLFKSDLPNDVLKTADVSFADIYMLQFTRTATRLKQFGVSASVSVDSIFGNVFSGAGEYLNEDEDKDVHKHSSLFYKLRTKKSYINIFHKKLEGVYSEEAIKNSMATHVVISITWGANCVIDCEYEKNIPRDQTIKTGSLKDVAETIGKLIKGALGKDTGNSKDYFKSTVYGDILPPTGATPDSVEKAVKLIAQVPKWVKQANGGKGVPLEYVLYPLSKLDSVINKGKDEEALINDLQEQIVAQINEMRDELSEAKEELIQFYNLVYANRPHVSTVIQRQISDYRNAINIKELHIKTEIKELITKLGEKEGRNQAQKLVDNLIKKFNSEDGSPQSIRTKVDSWDFVKRKILLAKELLGNGSQVLGHQFNIADKLVDSPKSFVLFYNMSSFKDENRWVNNKFLFINEIRRAKKNNATKETKFFAVDCDLQKSRCPKLKRSSSVSFYQASTVVIQDMFELQSEKEECMLRWGTHLPRWKQALNDMSSLIHYIKRERNDE